MAAASAVLLVGCGAAPGQTVAASTTTTSEIADAIDSWQSWGLAGQRWLDQCGEAQWECLNIQVENLGAAAKNLPWNKPGSTPPSRLLKIYQDDYADYASFNCNVRGSNDSGTIDVEKAIRCGMADQTLPQSIRAVREVVDNLAAG